MAYDKGTFEMTIYLSNFVGARTVVQEDENGEPEVGIFIPADRNALVNVDGDKWLTWGFVQEMDIPMLGFTHRVMQKTNPKFVRESMQKGDEQIMIARMKPTKFYHRKKTNINTRVNNDEIDL